MSQTTLSHEQDVKINLSYCTYNQEDNDMMVLHVKLH